MSHKHKKKCIREDCKVMSIDLGECEEMYPCSHPKMFTVCCCGAKKRWRGSKTELFRTYWEFIPPIEYSHFQVRLIPTFESIKCGV